MIEAASSRAAATIASASRLAALARRSGRRRGLRLAYASARKPTHQDGEADDQDGEAEPDERTAGESAEHHSSTDQGEASVLIDPREHDWCPSRWAYDRRS